MADNYGTGVSRVLDPVQAQLIQVIWQQGKPPLDSELNMMQQLATDWRKSMVLRNVPSGWLGNAVGFGEVYETNSLWSNWFRFGQQRTGEKRAIQWAVVNGWIIPVTGTQTGTPPGSPNDADTWNRITLSPPPSNSGDSRIDFAFLEVWLARIPPDPATDNKPSASGMWRYGNVEGGYSFLADDLQDPSLGFETTQRVQVQYRVRVVSGLVGLTSNPDGFDPAVVKARGAATAVTSFVFENMREELGDPGLWRAGDGTQNALGTVDGYTYAIPLCAIFRRNSVAWDGDPGQNLNGSFNRNPTAVDRTGWTTFSTTPTLNAAIDNATLSLTLQSASNIPLPLTPASAVTIKIGDEFMTYSAITGTTMSLVQRGALGSRAEAHSAGDTIQVVTGRPDGLFADQVAATDVLDLRHVVSPNGFDYDTLLRSSLDKLLRGQLRANWKRSGGGPQGPFVFYQDKVSNSAAALGVTKLDGPDNIRQVFSDAAMIQRVEFVAQPPTTFGNSEAITTSWSLSLTGTVDNDPGGAATQFNPGDVITIPITQFKTGLPGADGDQIRFLGSADGPGSVHMRIDGDPFPLVEGTHYSVTTAPTPTTNLQITLEAGFPATTTNNLYIQLHILYGPGRGLSRRADSVHSIAFLNTNVNIMTQLTGVPANNIPMRAAWALQWSRYRRMPFKGLLPVTTESYVDAGSKTLILTPFRKIELPGTVQVLDGTAVNPNDQGTVKTTDTNGSTTSGSGTFTSAGNDFTADGVVAGDSLVITSPAEVAGVYPVGTVGTTTLDLATGHTFRDTAASIEFEIYSGQGLMPLNDREGNAKWTTTDPLNVFSGTTDPAPATKNLFIPIERSLMPNWGEVRIPVTHSDPTSVPSGGTSTFDEGINFGILTSKGDSGTKPNAEANFVPFTGHAPLSYAALSTWDFSSSLPATFNASFAFSGTTFAGIRFFTDTRGLGRKGLELPPFYGVARLFAVYERADFQTNGSAYNPTTREFEGGATNLLRQTTDSGATFWIEIDEDGDSTFILSADAIDIDRSPNTIASFEAGHYVIEANIFGFDRGSWDIANGFRLVLARARGAGQADSGTRTDNFGAGGSADIISPDLVVPGPASASDEIAINYSRVPYQGDAWGSQAAQQDIPHQQGPITTGNLFQLTSTVLDEDNLTRPNQKQLEVVSAIGFLTTLGSGRLSGDIDTTNPFDFRNVGYENLSAFPPLTGSDPRPPIEVGAVTAEEAVLELGTEYANCVERLPLGAEYRDKDFRGGYFNSPSVDFRPGVRAPLVYTNDFAPGIEAVGVALDSNIEQVELPVNTSSLASGQPSEIVAHVDGEQGNYALLTNYRTNRGGSAFTLSGFRPGGELSTVFQTAGISASYGGVLSGVAYLVRNTVTTIGSNEVSPGSELMMLISTNAAHLDPTDNTVLRVLLGTNGTGEGSGAVDIYRIPGHPMVVDNVRTEIDPSDITLSRRSS